MYQLKGREKCLNPPTKIMDYDETTLLKEEYVVSWSFNCVENRLIHIEREHTCNFDSKWPRYNFIEAYKCLSANSPTYAFMSE